MRKDQLIFESKFFHHVKCHHRLDRWDTSFSRNFLLMIRSAFVVITFAADKIQQPHILIMRRHQHMLVANVSQNEEPHQPNYLEDIFKSQNRLIIVYLNHHSKCQAILILDFVFAFVLHTRVRWRRRWMSLNTFAAWEAKDDHFFKMKPD